MPRYQIRYVHISNSYSLARFFVQVLVSCCGLRFFAPYRTTFIGITLFDSTHGGGLAFPCASKPQCDLVLWGRMSGKPPQTSAFVLHFWSTKNPLGRFWYVGQNF